MAYTNIDDPSAYFQIKTGVGASQPQSHTFDGNSDLQPDFLWWKRRDSNGNHTLHDSSRGANKFLYANGSTSEGTDGNQITSFNTDGWSTGSSWFDLGSQTWVTWAWKANGGTTSSNTDGTLTGGATVQANTDAGFSIITYTGTSQTNPTVGHGLNQAPEIVIVKNRDLVRNWAVGSTAVGWTKYLDLDTADAVATGSGYWGNQDPTSTTVGIGTISNTAGNTYDYVMYAFHSVQGYSKFGKYVSNGNADGPFVYTGFKPAFVIIKSSTAKPWVMKTAAAISENPINELLYPNLSNAEGSDGLIDFVSNGFKVREGPDANINNSLSSDYIYMAFAENPFTTSTGIPTTAR